MRMSHFGAGLWARLRKAQMLRLIPDYSFKRVISKLLTWLEEGQRARCCYRALQPCEPVVLAAARCAVAQVVLDACRSGAWGMW